MIGDVILGVCLLGGFVLGADLARAIHRDERKEAARDDRRR